MTIETWVFFGSTMVLAFALRRQINRNDRLTTELWWALATVERLAGGSLTKLNARGRAHVEEASSLIGREYRANTQEGQ